MPARVEFLDQTRTLTLADIGLDPAEQSRQLAAFARAQLAEVVQSGAANPRHETLVDGRAGASEDQVSPKGTIEYDFAILSDIAQAALEWLRENSPAKSGAYRDGHFILLGGSRTKDPEQIPVDAAGFTITNDRPYSRKIEVGAIKTSKPPFVYDHCCNAMKGLYGAVAAFRVLFIPLDGGYVLKQRNRKHPRKRGRRKGDAMTYPSLAVTRK